MKTLKVGLYGAAIAIGLVIALSAGSIGCDMVSSASDTDVLGGVGLLAFMFTILGYEIYLGGKGAMKLLKYFGMLAVVFCLALTAGCKFIPPGHVGVMVDLYGTNRGVQGTTLVTGRVWYDPWTKQIYEFPTFMQYRAWTANTNEGNPVDESITFVSSDRIRVNVDVSVAYQFEPDKVPALFVQFRQTPDDIADNYIRSRVRDAFVRSGSKLKAMDILGPGISTLDIDVKDDVDKEMGPIGIHFDYVSVIGTPRIPENILHAINSSIESTQLAQQAMNQVAVKKAEADQAVAVATGEANAIRAKADGDAYATLTNAKSQAQANQLLSQSITPELVRYKQVQIWDGKLPFYMGGNGAVPFMSVDQSTVNK